MLKSFFKSFTNSIGRTLGRIITYVLIALALLILFSDGVFAAENETFYSKTLLGRFANGDWQPVVALTSQTNELILAQLGESDYYDVYPIWMGFYGSATYGFTTDKIYNLSFRVDYSSSGNRFFDWKKAMQYAQMEIVIENAVVSYCTMNANTNSYSEFTCEFKVSQNSGSYYEINVNWWNTNLSQLGFNGIYPEYGMILKFDLTMTSNTDYGGQIVSQNEIIIGQNQQIIDSNNATNDKLDQAEETRKGIWETIKDLPNQFLNMLKSLFIPDDGYFENWFNDLKLFFEEKLGFLATPFTIFIDFINMYLELDADTDIIINIPDISVPNFEEHKIISATTFNWSELLKSKESLNTLWQLYLAFVDVFLILNFINFCENKYNRIFGGDTANYEYYTVEDSITYDNDTGEVTGRRMNERRTTRKRV